MTEPCIRCGVHPSDPTCDWLHCAECFQLHCDEVHMAWAELGTAHEPEAEDDPIAWGDLPVGELDDDEIEF
jgi:hypothetical protein